MGEFGLSVHPLGSLVSASILGMLSAKGFKKWGTNFLHRSSVVTILLRKMLTNNYLFLKFQRIMN